MPHVEEIADVTADPDTLWRFVGSFQRVAEWHPMLASVEGDGERPGAIRKAIGEDGSEQVERLEEIDLARRRYSYAMEASAMPVRDYRAELRVQAKDGGGSTVRSAADFDVTGGDSDETVGMVRGFLAAGVHSLAERYGE